MKKARLIPLLALLLAVLCGTACAASMISTTFTGAVRIASIADATGAVSSLTDDNTATTWTRTATTYGPDLTINLYSATVGEIWIRNGHCYSQNYYNHYDRPDVITVTIWYSANRYTSTSATYRYRMSDVFRPGTASASWNNGYQRLLLPQAFNGVTRIELTISSVTEGYGRTGATISDIIVTQGSHTTATPAARVTATPTRYVSYVTPTQPLVQVITPVPVTQPPVQVITPVPVTRPPVTQPPAAITTNPGSGLPTEQFPSAGVQAPLLRAAATRSGPGNRYDEPGSFFSAGAIVNVVGKVWDQNNELYWLQIEFSYRGEWMRAYTTDTRVNVDTDLIPEENTTPDIRECLGDSRVYFGPGEDYAYYKVAWIRSGARIKVYAVENGWAQIEYHDYAADVDRRGWIPADIISTYPYPW